MTVENEKAEAVETNPMASGQGETKRERIQEVSVLHLGIDLGTSRCAVASSTGVRACVGSVIGWPKDAVARKVRGGNAPLFGDEAMAKRLSLDIVWPLADGNLRFPSASGEEREKYRRAGLELLNHVKSLCNPKPGQPVFAVIGAPAEASQKSKQAIVEIAREAGIDSVMVVSEPFSVAYGIDTLEEALVIDIGAGTIDLCRLHGALPEVEDQYTVFKAGNYVDEELAKLIKAKNPNAQFTINMVKKAKERFSGVIASNDRAIVNFPVNGVPTDIDITEEMQQAVGTLVPEMLIGIQKLVASFDPEFQHRIRRRVFVSGGGSQIFGLQKALEEGMESIGGGQVFLVDEPTYAGANGALKLATEMPDDYWNKLRG